MIALLRIRTLAAVATFAMLAPAVGRADEPAPADTALKLVPADAEVYGATLRLGETVSRIAASNAWQSVWNHPLAQMWRDKGWEELQSEESEWAMIQEFFAQPENRDILPLLGDAMSHEVITYTGSGMGDFLSLMQEVGGSMRYGPKIEAIAGGNPQDQVNDQAYYALAALADDPARIKMPEIVLGFKVTDPDKVTAQLRRLDPLLTDALKETPLAGRVKRIKIGGDDFLTLEVDGSLVPWDKVDIDQFEREDGEFDALQARLKTVKLSVTIGVRKGYLLVALGPTGGHVAKFGGAGPKLASVPEVEALSKYAGKEIVSIGYTSAKLLAVAGTTQDDVLGMGEMFTMFLTMAELPDALEGRIAADIDAFVKSLSREVTVPGAFTSLSYRTPTGWETFTHDYSPADEYPAQLLTILDHVGGDPLVLAAGRSRTTVADYQSLAKWVGVFGGHAEEIIELKSPDAEEALKVYRGQFKPLIRKLGKVIETKWLPALEDGQQAIVLDAKWKSKQWHMATPPAEDELPLPEIGLILGVSDEAKFVDAMKAFRDLANTAIARVRELDESGEMPEFTIPAPTVETADGKTYAFYPIPDELGADAQFRPTAGLGHGIAAVTLSKGHTDRMLDKTPLRVKTAPFADKGRPIDSAFHFNWAGWVTTFSSWTGYGMAISGAGDNPAVGGMAAQATGLVGVFRGYSAVTYREGRVTVTHSEAVFRDVPPPSDR